MEMWLTAIGATAVSIVDRHRSIELYSAKSHFVARLFDHFVVGRRGPLHERDQPECVIQIEVEVRRHKHFHEMAEAHKALNRVLWCSPDYAGINYLPKAKARKSNNLLILMAPLRECVSNFVPGV
jgi:hypothetical protein